MVCPWRADEMDAVADDLDWQQKDTLKVVGNFDDDYKALCEFFELPEHPCLEQRRQKQQPEDETAATRSSTAMNISNSNSNSSKNKSFLHVRNFVVDRTTLMIMLEALKRSSNIDTFTFHNTGLNNASVRLLAEGLPHTPVRFFSLDYNSDGTKQNAGVATEAGQNEAAPPLRPSAEALADLVSEASKLKALSLRGNGLGDREAAAIAEAIETNTTLCSLNLFDNAITDDGAAAIAASLRLNTVLRGLSLSRNHLTAVSAETFGLLLAGGYEVSLEEIEKRSVAKAKITALNKTAQDAMKKKRDAKVETRLPLSEISKTKDGQWIAGGSRSLAALNLSDNRELGADGAIPTMLAKLVEARNEAAPAAMQGTAVVTTMTTPALQELHLRRCQASAVASGNGDGREDGDGKEDVGTVGLIAAACLALKPTAVYT